jgi:hypothetical protein
VAHAKNRFGLTSQPNLNEIVYRRPWPIRADRLVPVPVISSPTSPRSVPSRAKTAHGGANS